jgi:hypothetical protein
MDQNNNRMLECAWVLANNRLMSVWIQVPTRTQQIEALKFSMMSQQQKVA